MPAPAGSRPRVSVCWPVARGVKCSGDCLAAGHDKQESRAAAQVSVSRDEDFPGAAESVWGLGCEHQFNNRTSRLAVAGWSSTQNAPQTSLSTRASAKTSITAVPASSVGASKVNSNVRSTKPASSSSAVIGVFDHQFDGGVVIRIGCLEQ